MNSERILEIVCSLMELDKEVVKTRKKECQTARVLCTHYIYELTYNKQVVEKMFRVCRRSIDAYIELYEDWIVSDSRFKTLDEKVKAEIDKMKAFPLDVPSF